MIWIAFSIGKTGAELLQYNVFYGAKSYDLSAYLAVLCNLSAAPVLQVILTFFNLWFYQMQGRFNVKADSAVLPYRVFILCGKYKIL